jgi:hypothetical protein
MTTFPALSLTVNPLTLILFISYNLNFSVASLFAFLRASTPPLLALKRILSTLSSVNLAHSLMIA